MLPTVFKLREIGILVKVTIRLTLSPVVDQWSNLRSIVSLGNRSRNFNVEKSFSTLSMPEHFFVSQSELSNNEMIKSHDFPWSSN